MARMTFDELYKRGVVGGDIWGPLSKQVNAPGWEYTGGGNNEGGSPSGTGQPDPALLSGPLGGYTFDWQDTGPANTGTLTAFDPSGAQVGRYAQKDQTAGGAFGDWAKLAAIGFGGAGLAGLGPLAGAFGGLGGAGSTTPAAGNGAFLGETAAGLGGSGAGGLGLTEAVYGAGGALGGGGAGLGGGLAGGLGGGAAAGGGSFWGGLAKAAIGPALSAGTQMIGANQAAKAQQAATSKANDLQRYIYDTTRADNMPALQARNSALQQMQALLSDPSSLTKQPGYQFGLDQGTKTLNNGAAARGMTYSGAQGKALQRFGQDYAGSKIDQSFNRLSALASGGQPGAGTIAGAANNYGNQVGNNLSTMGEVNATKYLIGGNAIGDAVNGLTAYGQRKGWWGG